MAMTAARIRNGSPLSELANSAASPEKLPLTVAGMPIACSALLMVATASDSA